MSLPMGGFLEDNNVSADNSLAINSKIMIAAVVVLFGVVMFILGLHIYAKWFWRHRGHHGGSIGGVGWRRRRRLEFAPDHQRITTHVGLEKSVLDQLPTFTFDEQKATANNEGGLECAVCLEEFADGEKGRLLPKCNHSFHIDCIDMWFHSHSTCPLCRCSVVPEVSSPSPALSIIVQQHQLPYSDGSSQNDDGVGARPSPSGAVVVNISEGVAVSGQEGLQTSSGASTVFAVVEHGAEFYSPPDSAGGGGLVSPRQQQQGPRPESPASRRPSTGLSPKPSGIQYPANVLFWQFKAGASAGAADLQWYRVDPSRFVDKFGYSCWNVTHREFLHLREKYGVFPERYLFDREIIHPTESDYPLRPELAESSFFLYQATEDPWYWRVGELLVNYLNIYSRVAGGFASVRDVLTIEVEDHQRSLFLSETCKYLYLLFDDSFLKGGNYFSTTERRPLPVFRAWQQWRPSTAAPLNLEIKRENKDSALELRIYPNLQMVVEIAHVE